MTWTFEGPIGPRPRLTSDTARLTPLPDGDVVAYLARVDRTDHPHEGLGNPETLGYALKDPHAARCRSGFIRIGARFVSPGVGESPAVGDGRVLAG